MLLTRMPFSWSGPHYTSHVALILKQPQYRLWRIRTDRSQAATFLLLMFSLAHVLHARERRREKLIELRLLAVVSFHFFPHGFFFLGRGARRKLTICFLYGDACDEIKPSRCSECWRHNKWSQPLLLAQSSMDYPLNCSQNAKPNLNITHLLLKRYIHL
jgi:hypothetical protein